MSQYIYLIREREFLRLNENTYKIGKTRCEPNTRLNGYPKGSEVVLFHKVNNCDDAENRILSRFRKHYVQKTEYGVEYFEGDVNEMLRDIREVLYDESTKITNGLDKSYEILTSHDQNFKKIDMQIRDMVTDNTLYRNVIGTITKLIDANKELLEQNLKLNHDLEKYRKYTIALLTRSVPCGCGKLITTYSELQTHRKTCNWQW